MRASAVVNTAEEHADLVYTTTSVCLWQLRSKKKSTNSSVALKVHQDLSAQACVLCLLLKLITRSSGEVSSEYINSSAEVIFAEVSKAVVVNFLEPWRLNVETVKL